MIRIKCFLSFKELQGRGVSFRDRKKGYVLVVDKIIKSLYYDIKKIYYVSGLKYSLQVSLKSMIRAMKLNFCLIVALSPVLNLVRLFLEQRGSRTYMLLI